MKKVMVIAFGFPPHPHVGSLRPYALAKYLPGYGWEPVILTVKRQGSPLDEMNLIETDITYVTSTIKAVMCLNSPKTEGREKSPAISTDTKHATLINKCVKFLREAVKFPDEQRAWYRFAVRSASEYIMREKVDMIISTAPPMSSHLIAKKLKQKYNIPWVADLRDLWTQNHFYDKSRFIRYFEKRLELKTLSGADTIVTVTHRFADKLRLLHEGKKIVCITNGYDPDDFSLEPARLRSKFTVSYTGNLYNGKMDPSPLFDVISELIKEDRINKDIVEIRFYCRNENWLKDKIERYNLNGVIKHCGFLPRGKVIEKQRESQLLLLLVDKKTEIDYYPAKVFEYFAARRPILAFGGKGGIVKELMEETGVGAFANDYIKLKDIFLRYYQEFIRDGSVQYHGNANIENYTYQRITEKYSQTMNGILQCKETIQ